MSIPKTNETSDYGQDIFSAKMRATFLSMLHENVVEITFNKVDGSERVMLCTLNYMLLPQAVLSKDPKDPKTPRKINTDVIACYDLEAEGWRSFRLDSITNFEFSLEQNTKWGI